MLTARIGIVTTEIAHRDYPYAQAKALGAAQSAITTTHQQQQLPASDRFFAINLVPAAGELPNLPEPAQLLTSEPQ